MDIRSQNVGSDSHNDTEATELGSTPIQPDEISLIHKDDNPNASQVRQRSLEWLSAWIFEIISSLAAFVVFTAVIAILVGFDGHPNPLWSFGITLNTVISVASMIFRVSLMVPVTSCISQLSWTWLSQNRRPLQDIVRFDQASRSPYGSLQLLISHHVQSLAFLGAVVSLFSLLIGPFFQQSLVFYRDMVLDKSIDAYASYASTFSPSVGFPGSGGVLIPPNLRTAVYSGLLYSGAISSPDAPFMCPSGNCEWDPFPTLAVGVQCRDAPELFSLECANDSDNPERCAIVAIDDPHSFTSFYDLNGTQENEGWGEKVFYFAEAAVRAGGYPLDSSRWTIPIGARFDIDWIRTTDVQELLKEPNKDRWFVVQNSTIESRRCKLYTCVQEISAQVRNGTYSEAVNSTIINGTEYASSDYDYGLGYSYVFTNRLGVETNITIGWREQSSLIEAIQAPFNALQVVSGGVSTGNLALYAGDKKLKGNDLLKILYQTANLTEMVHTLAHHINIALRSIDTFADLQANRNDGSIKSKEYVAPKEQWRGRAYSESIHVRARFEWLILPGLLMTFAFALLVATIVQTRGQRIGVWKENPLALLLFSNLDNQCKPATDCGRTEKDIRLAAEGLDAQLTVGVETGSRDMKNRILIRRKVEI